VKVTFRRAVFADVPAVVALVESTYRGEGSRIGWTTEADLLDGPRTDAEEVRESVEAVRSCIVLGLRGEQLVACANVRAEGDVGYFGMFSVVPSLQRAGVGKVMLAEAERIARDDWQLPTMRMSVIDIRDELIAYYERRGYRRTGIKKPFPYGEERFGIPRRADLRFEVLEKPLR
jgi:ribosomal protein S18 acetylase RimI-like enzyme